MFSKKSIKILINFTLSYIFIVSIIQLFVSNVIREKLREKLNRNYLVKLFKITEKNNKNKFIEKSFIYYGSFLFLLIIINLVYYYYYPQSYIKNIKNKLNIKTFFVLLINLLITLLIIYILSIVINYGYFNIIINKYKIIDLN